MTTDEKKWNVRGGLLNNQVFLDLRVVAPRGRVLAGCFVVGEESMGDREAMARELAWRLEKLLNDMYKKINESKEEK